MNKTQTLILFALLLILPAALHALGNADTAAEEEPKLVEVTGVVRLVGTGLFNDIVISSEDNDWYVTQEEMHKLHDLQQQRVTVEAEEIVVELQFASGMSAGKRRILSKIRVLRVE